MQILFLVMSALVFAMWALSIVRTILAVRNRAATRTGNTIPGTAETLREWDIWWRDPALRPERRQLFFMTCAVAALAILASLPTNPPALD